MLHYYGDFVRRLFFGGAFVMLATLPLFRNLVPIPILSSAILVVLLTLIAAITNPSSRLIAALNVGVAAAAVVFFEYYAVSALGLANWDFAAQLFFWINHFLAINFIIALYYSAKTLRGMMR